ncbi:MAG: hypothetical protein KatS3mg103_0422 [Phycisphaerales bacterium]|nr:MAG: hypothetical protein KatS3mg103_0422 [Phycisphaerales bacterium]
MGNTVVLKPSDKTPAVGQLLAELFQAALDEHGAPRGVVNLVQGGADVARRLVTSDGLDGIAFTGSWPVGRQILQANLDRPGRIVALEMGGNNGVLVMPDADLRQAAIEIVRGAFVTTGQRCTCGRRLIVHRDVADRLIPAVLKAAASLVIGPPRGELPVFMGPLIDDAARQRVLDFQSAAADRGAQVLMQASPVAHPGAGRLHQPLGAAGSNASCPRTATSPAATWKSSARCCASPWWTATRKASSRSTPRATAWPPACSPKTPP